MYVIRCRNKNNITYLPDIITICNISDLVPVNVSAVMQIDHFKSVNSSHRIHFHIICLHKFY